MAKLKKPITGVKNGDVYPTEFAAGDDCPPELVEAAIALGALDEKARKEAATAPAGADTLPGANG